MIDRTDPATLVKSTVDLGSYSSSPGYIGHFERKGPHSDGTCRKALDLFFASRLAHSKHLAVASSLYASSDLPALACEYGLTESHLKRIEAVRELGLLRLVDMDELASRYESDEYFTRLDNLALEFTVAEPVTMRVCEELLFAVMTVDGLRGHGFAIVRDRELIAYPHDDAGLGFISYCGNRVGLAREVVETFSTSEFEVVCARPPDAE